MLILILGGVRSGKSRFALLTAKRQCKKVLYIATAPGCDREMKKRIKKHKDTRPGNWDTIEVQYDVHRYLKKQVMPYDGILFECVGTYISNLLFMKHKSSEIIKHIEELIQILSRTKKKVIVVSNIVGDGVIPKNQHARRFIDIIGIANQKIAEVADEIYMMVSGIPIKIK